MKEEKNIYEMLLQKGISQQELHTFMYKFIMMEIEERRAKEAAASKNKFRIFFRSLKNGSLFKKLKGKALSLLKTQYAKKPKNPV
ncbi:hypothetical protein FRZ67_19125 [Panacibacter ginsenosidivorans]|uniref:Uncharacterized protein n=1 Tax=Panacibacter ginsenosidivorans TaxID=1813871 RepID=A0A5B8VFJ9_9BACT|nr:hypothetical protein [Panacibacter ginsenosidivorans]QEC69316.1 hypothetical protein FRZ67_19125 [Panacibacter ginsenosidivorans]